MKLTLDSADDDIVCLRCSGKISDDSGRWRSRLEKLLGRAGYKRKVLLNLSEARHIDSSGIGWLLIGHRQFQKAGGKLVLHSVPAEISKTLGFVQMHAFLTIAEDEETARMLVRGDG